MKKKICLAIGGLFVLLIVVGIAVSGDSESSTRQTATPTPITPVANVTAVQLLSEREANATRYDATYKGKWVAITGRVDRIDDGKVYLEGNDFISSVALEDLSEGEQIALDVGQSVTYTCRVGDYILGTIFARSCR